MNNHSFVIPAYKESPYLEACIQSLLSQTVGSEILICTSTPSQFLKDIAKEYNLPYLINSNSITSIANDWNFALSQSKTQYVTIAHQDDIYEPSYTQNFLESLNKENEILIAFSNYHDLIGGEVKNSINRIVKELLLSPFLIKSSINNSFLKKLVLSFGSPICCPTVTFNKYILNDFEFDNNYKVALDWLAWLQLAKRKGGFLYINKELVKHRIHLASETTAQLQNGKRKEEEFKILSLIWGKHIAKLIAYFYAFGHQGNKV